MTGCQLCQAGQGRLWRCGGQQPYSKGDDVAAQSETFEEKDGRVGGEEREKERDSKFALSPPRRDMTTPPTSCHEAVSPQQMHGKQLHTNCPAMCNKRVAGGRSGDPDLRATQLGSRSPIDTCLTSFFLFM